MAMFQAPLLTAQTSHAQLLDEFAKVVKELEFIVNGAIDSRNVREIGGYNVNKTELQSRDGAVGMSSARTDEDDLRIWAGDPDRAKAAFKVFESGLVTLTKFLLSSTNGEYPKIEMGSEGNLLAAFYNEGTYISIEPDYGQGPSLNFVRNGEIQGRLNTILGFEVLSIGNMNIQSAGGSIKLNPSETVDIQRWSKLKNVDENKTLQDELNEIYNRLESLENP
ncbi:hypothetical protein [Paenibacillus ottowii]|uniref:Uncharacterized protein n=1 Tax=Paenibacillus ottowii TaxID=2315729 RepID=A0ABY3B0T9_9BACL|nr:hypothetical protein [Paenibacillus ottowii]TQR97306.1 hypothetical protein FKV70_18925 [Paenibacillus ottowii]